MGEEVFLADNSQLNAPTWGIRYRTRKERSEDTIAVAEDDLLKWGTTVTGEDCGDGWLRCAEGFLPFNIAGCKVLVSIKQAPTDMYLIDNSQLNASSFGLGYRSSKCFEDKKAPYLEAIAPWGSTVLGTADGDDWLCVGGQFLPMRVDGVPVVRHWKEVQNHEFGSRWNSWVCKQMSDRQRDFGTQLGDTAKLLTNLRDKLRQVKETHQSSLSAVQVKLGSIESRLQKFGPPARIPQTPRKRSCRLRIIAINDVYELANFAKLKTLIDCESKGFPPGNVVTTLAGDFIGPSLLSSLDAGYGMVRMMNQMPVDMVCFGNHETDIPYSKLVHRIEEFNGTWLNSNMPDFEPKLPDHKLIKLTGDNGEPDARTVAFGGFCIGGGKFGVTYRDDAFGGAYKTMVEILEAAPKLVHTLRSSVPELDCVIPITHQDMPEDVALAESGLFPVVVAGHDHDIIIEKHGEYGCPVVKAGMDANGAAIIDLVWSDDSKAPPQVSVRYQTVGDFEDDPKMKEELEVIHKPVREIEAANMYELQPGEKLTSNGVKFGEASMARLVASALRDCLNCDAAVVNAGAVRGKKDYDSIISYGDLKKECPYPTSIVTTRMPFEILRDAIKESRRPWWDVPEGEPPQEGNSAFQVDHGIDVDSNHIAQTIGNREPLAGDILYSVACDVRYLKKNPVFDKYCKQFPDRVQKEEAGRPVLPILVEYFCGQMWRRLTDTCAEECCEIHEVEEPMMKRNSSRFDLTDSNVSKIFQIFDVDHSGLIDHDELRGAIQKRMGERLSSHIIVDQMISMMDSDSDGQVSVDELMLGLKKVLHVD